MFSFIPGPSDALRDEERHVLPLYNFLRIAIYTTRQEGACKPNIPNVRAHD
jgi:hypothetical protein